MPVNDICMSMGTETTLKAGKLVGDGEYLGSEVGGHHCTGLMKQFELSQRSCYLIQGMHSSDLEDLDLTKAFVIGKEMQRQCYWMVTKLQSGMVAAADSADRIGEKVCEGADW